MGYKDVYLRELCFEVVHGNVGGQRFNDLLIKTGVFLDDHEWTIANRLLEESEQIDHLKALTTASIH
jgi:hypothetical protein